MASVKIRDNGTGMDEDAVAHLFDRYYRGTNTSEHQVKGSGLGTAIANQLIEANGGHISVGAHWGAAPPWWWNCHRKIKTLLSSRFTS
ncbi:ATP-binding protein [Alicyclobacillus fastidiosus]|uniref:histidine kinase n=2 Tax=Alicyclobacillus fastidiosus TaxID=392011 RepID=A0ABY6ZB89_9BACL|nr:ATP-binding protein [Alicyclobacillus fastidiosus]WAH39802.1 ATP-binding protein [Alicyclobacillus fastidiosus]GMA61056.1 hypothetical protein GCM10025859_14960 [Alicyclobacillus fastidiosus]